MSEQIITSKDGKTKIIKTTEDDGLIWYSFINDDKMSFSDKKKHEGIYKWINKQ